MHVYRVGYQQNDAYTAYLRMEAPAQLSRDQVKRLNDDTSGGPVNTGFIQVGKEGFSKAFAMYQNDVVLVILQPDHAIDPR